MKKVIDASYEVIEGPRPQETVRGRVRRGVGPLIWIYWGLLIAMVVLGVGGLLLTELLPENADRGANTPASDTR